MPGSLNPILKGRRPDMRYLPTPPPPPAPLSWLIRQSCQDQDLRCLPVSCRREIYRRWVFWALVSEPGFLDFQISRCAMFKFLFVCKICSINMLVRFRGINHKGVLDRPWTIWRVLRAISCTWTFQFTVNPES